MMKTLVARDERLVARALDQLANVVDAGVGGGVHLDDVGMPALHDLGAVPAEHGHVEGRRLDGVGLVVERAGDDARRRRLADAAHAGEHVGLRDAPRRERVAQRLDHRLLADEVVERLRTVFARQHDIRLSPRRLRRAARSSSLSISFSPCPCLSGPKGPGRKADPAASRRPRGGRRDRAAIRSARVSEIKRRLTNDPRPDR